MPSPFPSFQTRRIKGLLYLSPGVRDLQACTELRDDFCNIDGEEFVLHPSFCNSPKSS